MAQGDDAGHGRGQGDRSRAWWRNAHRNYCAGKRHVKGSQCTTNIETVFERFICVARSRPKKTSRKGNGTAAQGALAGGARRGKA